MKGTNMHRLTREEWETHISIDAEGECAIIDTSIPKDINKCKKLGYEIVRENHYEDGTICSVIFKAPRRAITFRSMEAVNRKGVPMSEKRKNKLREGRERKRGF